MSVRIFLMALSLLFAACNSEESKKSGASQVPVNVQKSEVAKKAVVTNISWDQSLLLQKEGAVYLDVRNPPELMEGYVAGALTIPLPELEQRFAELPQDKKLMVYCRSGRRSQAASDLLVSKGFSLIYNIEGGFMAAPPSSVLPRAR